ncbi:HTH domain-containing protein [Sulfobacillus thermosulfidooxidans]|uniref:HTH domain-containing protein n=1 Tax=Sulfobacillus thermosulfidooxidans TaxID=28034 RepID=UPI00130120BA|nr:HTH domain-containing protein [Sulfobacillus thermosulfidooxidans]
MMPSSLRERILEYLDQHKEVTTEQLQKIFGVSRRHIQRHLHQLVEEHRVSMTLLPGSHHTGVYQSVLPRDEEFHAIPQLLRAIEKVGGKDLLGKVLEQFTDQYYGHSIDQSLEALSQENSVLMDWKKSPNGWWITMRQCPLPNTPDAELVCQAEARTFSKHFKAPAIHFSRAETGVCQFFIPQKTVTDQNESRAGIAKTQGRLSSPIASREGGTDTDE